MICDECDHLGKDCGGTSDGRSIENCIVGRGQNHQAGREAVSAGLALLSAAKVKKEKTPSGMERPYVSVLIANLEFKREYYTEQRAIKCAEKINKLLASST